MYKNQGNLLLGILLSLASCCFFTDYVPAQQQATRSQRFLDSIYNKYVSAGIPRPSQPGQFTPADSLDYSDHKCGFSLNGQIHANLRSFTAQQQKVISALDARPQLESSILSPSGHFRVHYDNSGDNKPSYDPSLSVSENIRQITLALDSVWSFEINFLGFPPPPADSMRGGDNAYDIYILNMPRDYGSTDFESEFGSNKWISFMSIDNDFNESMYFTHGFAAARATLAHEFHHAIQIGNYNFRDSDTFFHELTSTSMEEFVFSTSNDYLGYLRSYFNAPDKSFPLHEGYDLAIWNIFLKDRYGFGIIKRQWELYILNPALTAIQGSIVDFSNNQSSFKTELSEFGIWTFYTNFRAVPGKYFEEAQSYPVISPTVTEDFNPSIFPVRISSQALSNSFINIYLRTQNRVDTITAKITDGDLTRALDDPLQILDADFSVFSDSVDGSQRVVNQYYSKLVSSKNVFKEVDFFNGKIVSGNVVQYSEIDFAYPNPFNYKNILNNNQLNLPVAFNELKNASIYIYSIGMNLVYSGNRNIFADPQTDKYVVSWDGLDSKGSRLPTGVYIYITYSNGNIKKGKIVIQNE